MENIVWCICRLKAPITNQTTVVEDDCHVAADNPAMIGNAFAPNLCGTASFTHLSATQSRLYGKRGTLHLTFDHERFAEMMRHSAGKWLLTYDDCPEIRHNFSFALVQEWQLQYGMNNYKRTTAAKGNEVLIRNYTQDVASSAQAMMLF